MASYIKVLVVGHTKEHVAALEQALRREANVRSASRLRSNGHLDPLHGVRDIPDVLMLELSHHWEDELEALNIRPSSQRPIILAVGSSEDPQLLRRAMRSGVRDFLTIPIDPGEVSKALQRIVSEKAASEAAHPRRLTAVINAKGGSGATLLASNLSHIMAVQFGMRVALLDLDLQLGTSALCLNLHPRVSIGEALGASDDLDAVALAGYMTRHESGLEVLASLPHGFIDPVTASAEQMDRLLSVVSQNYDHVVIDVPRTIDPLTLSAMSHADRILLVVQQHLSHLHDAKRIVNTLRGQLEGIDQRVVVAVNRFNSKATVGIREIKDALHCNYYVEIPNDYKRVCEAENLGVPLYTHAPSSALTKKLCELARNLSGITPRKRGFLGRLFSDRHQAA